MKYIVELEKNVYLAPWEGEPGRTLIRKNAKVFHSENTASKAILDALNFRSFEDPKVIEIEGRL